jgi:single-stranded-DNA-specific exonuclease
MVELTHTNRILVRAGIEALENTTFPGLNELLKSCDITDKQINSEDIGFLLGPLLNAPGRLGDSHLSVKTLTANNSEEAKKFCKKLHHYNNERKGICLSSFESTLSELSSEEIKKSKCVIAQGNIHIGIAGIIASKFVDHFGFPAVVLGVKKENNKDPEKTILTGSLRSIEGINIVSILQKCSRFLVQFGGHEMAAGITLYRNNFSNFKQLFEKELSWAFLENKIKKGSKKNKIDCSIENLYDEKVLTFLKYLEPFGPGNERPLFFDEKATIVHSKKVGISGDHLQVAIRGKYSNFKGIGFGLGDLHSNIQKKPFCSILYSPTINRYRRTKSWQVRIIEIN